MAQAKGEEVVEEEESRGAQRFKKKKKRKEMWVILKAGKQAVKAHDHWWRRVQFSRRWAEPRLKPRIVFLFF